MIIAIHTSYNTTIVRIISLILIGYELITLVLYKKSFQKLIGTFRRLRTIRPMDLKPNKL